MKEILNKYHKASGLQINEKKTARLAINKITSETHLWDISWKTQKIEPLNITIGPPTVTKTWVATIKEIQQKAQNLNHQYVTYDLKAVISKTILTPYITHLAHTYHLPKQKHETVNTILAKYMAGYHNPLLDISKLSKLK